MKVTASSSNRIFSDDGCVEATRSSINEALLVTELLRNNLCFARQRPTLAGGVPPTTIGAGELNFRVRDGNGCDLSAIVTEQ